jgi:2-polyprenyl-3-methyl-5-hydroxy-6-metoxy-1,4-benzoquinol methylase
MNDTELQQVLARYAFYHIIKLTDTISTPGNPAHVPAQNLCLKYLKSLDLKGKHVLDIGCRDGLFSFAAESMGAAEVVGIISQHAGMAQSSDDLTSKYGKPFKAFEIRPGVMMMVRNVDR